MGLALILFMCGMSRGDTMTERTFDLDTLTWQARVLIVFAPDMTDTRVIEQRARLDAVHAGLVERDMAVFFVARDQIMERGGRRYEGKDAQALRVRFDIDIDAFTVVLVGKDGGEKARDTSPVSLVKVFALIDVMPMRRREMLERRR